MKKILSICCACALSLIVSVPLFAAAPGTTCSTAIPLGTDLYENISGPGVVWYSAWTFDLPLTVYFAPQNPTDPAPELEMDFSCRSGVYTDSILCSLFCKTGSSSGVVMEMPHKPSLSTDYLPDGTFVYYLSLGKKYRDLLLQMGISYNVEVFVKVTYKSAGYISIAPDDLFQNCMDGHKFMHLGDTVNVVADDKDRHVIVPYVQWQEDSIRYVWNGTQPVEVAVGNTCDYDPTDGTNEHRVDYFVLQPQDTLKMTSENVKYYIQSDDVSSEAGMFYAKFYTSGTGVMKIERVPQDPPQGGATLLRYDHATPVPADTNALFAIPYTWTKATIFTTPTSHIFKMYISTTPSFLLKDAFASYQFSPEDGGHWLGLMDAEMEALWTHTQAQYLYVRFECTEKTSVTPAAWRPSDCIKITQFISKNSTFIVNSKESLIRRIYYNDWKGGDMSVYWDQNPVCKMYISDTCKIGTSSTSASLLKYQEMINKTTYTIPAATIAGWANKVDADGYLYMRFYTTKTGGGNVTMSTTSPDETDPEPIIYPVSSISVVCSGEPTSAGQEYIIRVSSAQTLHMDNGTPWDQVPGETHTVTLQSGTHMLYGAEETVQIEVK